MPLIEKMPVVWGGAFLRRSVYSQFVMGFGKNILICENVVFSNLKKIQIGNNTKIMANCFLYAHSNGEIIIGDNCSINTNVQIGAADGGKIEIMDDCLIGPNSVLRAANHNFNCLSLPIRCQGHHGGTITIEKNCWLGANVCVLPGVRICEGSVIGAGAVVTKNIDAFSVAGGIPAKVIKSRIKK